MTEQETAEVLPLLQLEDVKSSAPSMIAKARLRARRNYPMKLSR